MSRFNCTHTIRSMLSDAILYQQDLLACHTDIDGHNLENWCSIKKQLDDYKDTYLRVVGYPYRR